VKIDKEIPLEEAKLGKAEYIEYYLTPDLPVRASTTRIQLVERAVRRPARRSGRALRRRRERLADGPGYPNRLVKLDPRTGVQKSYVLPDPRNGNHDVNIDRTG
jgi:hypothetical protein